MSLIRFGGDMKTPTILGKLSIIFCGFSFVVPPLIYALGQFFISIENVAELARVCWFIFVGFLFVAIILGIAGWKQKLAKVGFGISIAIALLLFLLVLFIQSISFF